MNYKRLFISNGLIFLTIVTNSRIPILIDNIAVNIVNDPTLPKNIKIIIMNLLGY